MLLEVDDKLIDELDQYKDFKSTVDFIQSKLFSFNKKPIPKEIISEIQNDIKSSTIDNIDAMCTKRVKDLFLEGEDFNSLKGFVKMMESVLN